VDYPSFPGISSRPICIPYGSEKLPGIRRKEAKMFQDALFVPERHLGDRAAALPLAALVHAVALAVLVTWPLLRVGELPRVDVSDVIVVPALPATPLPPPKARSGDPGARIAKKRAVAATAEAWRVAPEVVPVGIVEEGVLGAEGSEFGIPGGVDYGLESGLPANLLGDSLYGLVGDVEPPAIRAIGEVKPPRLVRRIEPDYPKLAQEARVQGVVILEATTDIYGRVAAIRVLKSIPLLDEAAVAAVRQWVYEPLMINGRPRPVTFSVTVHFELR
jgi:periplasmic protein TonB